MLTQSWGIGIRELQSPCYAYFGESFLKKEVLLSLCCKFSAMPIGCLDAGRCLLEHGCRARATVITEIMYFDGQGEIKYYETLWC